MTPTEIEEQAREQYNAVGDTFFSQSFILNLIYKAQMELAIKSHCIENCYSASSVDGQNEYSYPSKAIAIKRVTYDGVKLDPIDFRLQDTLTLNNATTGTQSDAKYYSIWDDTLYLFPTPDEDNKTIKIFSYDEPDVVTSTSTLDVPTRYHVDIIDYVVAQMFAKDQNTPLVSYHIGRWNDAVMTAVKYQAKRKRGDGMPVVKNEDDLDVTILGAI